MIASHRPFGALAACLLLSACHAPADDGDFGGDGRTTEATAPYPAGPYAVRRGATLPDLAFDGVSGDGTPTTIRLRDFVRDGEAEPRLLIIQESGGLWCGTCRWTASHLDELLGSLRGRVDRLDLVVASRDNAPASADQEASAWKDGVEATGVPVGVDPSFALGAALEDVPAPLPLVLLVDEATMTVAEVLANPSPTELAERTTSALAELDGAPAPGMPEEELVDDLFHRNEWDMFVAMATVPGAPPPDPTNEVADSEAARRLGKALFFDASLSPSGNVSCATCHDPSRALSDARPVGVGEGVGSRRTPSIALAAHARWQTWDGRADTLWAQALGPLESSLEFDSSRVFVARRIVESYAPLYQAAFPGSALPSPAGWPAAGKPGSASYDALADADKRAITELFVGAGKAIAAYERTFRVEPTTFDAYVNGDPRALSDEEKYGLVLFARSGCMQCHWGPRLTDDAFHVTRTATGRADGQADAGRADGLEAWAASEFRADGPWSAKPDTTRRDAAVAATIGQFKTPSLRGVAELSFFGHGGAVSTLSGVTEAYGLGGVPIDDPASIGEREPWLAHFGETAQWGLVPFLRTLTARAKAPGAPMGEPTRPAESPNRGRLADPRLNR